MKKITLLSTVLCSGLILSFWSCQKSINQYITIQVYYQGSLHQFESGAPMTLYPGYLQITGGQLNTSSAIGLGIAGSTSGKYPVSCCSPSSFDLNLYTSPATGSGYATTYTTETAGGWGTINITEFDSSSHFVKGTFSGTVVNTLSPSDSFSISQGAFSGTYVGY